MSEHLAAAAAAYAQRLADIDEYAAAHERARNASEEHASLVYRQASGVPQPDDEHEE